MKYSIKDLCNIFNKSESSIRLYNKELSIIGTKIGSRVFYSENDKYKIEKFLNDNLSTMSYFIKKNRKPKKYEDYYTFSQLSELFNKSFDGLEKLLNYLNIQSVPICKKPRLYTKEDKEKLENFLKEHPNTKKYFCSIHNSMKNEKIVNKIKLSWKNKSKEDINNLVQKRNKTRNKNNTKIKYNNTRESTILKNIPNEYTPFFKIYKYYDEVNKIPANKSDITSSICKYLDIEVILINRVKCIKTKDIDKIYKYIKNKYKNKNNFLGESLIIWYLKKKNVDFETQKTFDNCKSSLNRKLPFDFYLQDFNLCIELDGPTHYKTNVYYKKENLKNRKIKDNIKTEFCKNNNINLIRIPWLVKNINSEGKLIQKLENELVKYIPNIKEGFT